MTTAPDETRAWSRLKWVGVVFVIFAVQAGLMLWLGRSQPATVSPSKPPLEVHIPENQSAEMFGASSPMLLVTPNAESFSSVWLRSSAITNQPAQWNSQPDGTLPQPVSPPGDEIEARVRSSRNKVVSVLDRPKPAIEMVGIPPDTITESTFSIEGDLAKRMLLARPALVSPVSEAPLSNSVVEIDVNSDGVVVDPPVILPGGSSGLPETDPYAQAADAYARSVAMSLRFKPLERAGSASAHTWGRVVFHWHTLPPPATNNLTTP